MPRPKSPPILLSISGSDPSGGAGLEADLKVFQRLGVFGMAIPTLLTAQNTMGIFKVRRMDPDFLTEQWHTLFSDLRPRAIKIGALGSRDMALRVAALLSRKEAKGIPVVLDPVMFSTSGAALLERSAIPVLKEKLFPLCRLITPNVPEFSRLCGRKVTPENALVLLRRFGTEKSYAILLKGGHFPHPPAPSPSLPFDTLRQGSAQVLRGHGWRGGDNKDLLWDHGKLRELRGKRFPGPIPHGTGCALASAIAANIALGKTLEESCRNAKKFVTKAMRAAYYPGRGKPALDFTVHSKARPVRGR